MAAAYPGTGLAHPHAPSTVGSAAYAYDANGNLTSGGGKSITWDARNLPSTITVTTTPPPPPSGTPNLTAPSRGPAGSGSPSLTAPSRGGSVLPGTPNLTAPSRGNGTQATTTERYTYDADGARVTRTASGITTVYIGGLFEQDIQGGVLRSQYTLNGHVIAQRTQQGTANTLVYLHGDHLGSVSMATSETGAVLDKQEYGPWGNIRSGNVSETTLNYTGQKRDATGLLYYGARYYDPALGRFLSPDSMGTSLTNPQTLNRYAYVGNNPLTHTDPTGHCQEDDCFDNRDIGRDRAPEQDYERQREAEGTGDRAETDSEDRARDSDQIGLDTGLGVNGAPTTALTTFSARRKIATTYAEDGVSWIGGGTGSTYVTVVQSSSFDVPYTRIRQSNQGVLGYGDIGPAIAWDTVTPLPDGTIQYRGYRDGLYGGEYTAVTIHSPKEDPSDSVTSVWTFEIRLIDTGRDRDKRRDWVPSTSNTPSPSTSPAPGGFPAPPGIPGPIPWPWVTFPLEG